MSGSPGAVETSCIRLTLVGDDGRTISVSAPLQPGFDVMRVRPPLSPADYVLCRALIGHVTSELAKRMMDLLDGGDTPRQDQLRVAKRRSA